MTKKLRLENSATKSGWVDVHFKFSWDILEIVKALSVRTYDPERKVWSIPKHVVNELRVSAKLKGIPFTDESTKERVRIRVNPKDGFRLNCDDIHLNKVCSRLLYLRRPRDGYAYGKQLEAAGYDVKIVDGFKPFPLSESESNVELYNYQKDTLNFLQGNDFSGLVALDVGLGKTIIAGQAIREAGMGPVLIVVPASLIYQWVESLKKNFGIEATPITSKIKPADRLEAFENAEIAITNYEMLRSVDLVKIYYLLILDEAHRIKNWKSKTAQKVSELIATRVIGLTATPLENHLLELYNIVDQIIPGSLGTLGQFKKDHIEVDNWGSIIGYRNKEEVYEKLKPVMFRRRREEVRDDLPELICETIAVPLTRKEKEDFYDMFSGAISLGDVANAKVFCSSSKMKEDEPDLSSKEKELVNLLDNFDEKVVICTQFKKELYRLKDIISLSEWKVFNISGDTKTEDRLKEVEAFANYNGKAIMLMTEAGTEGTDGLQVANVLINFDIPWTNTKLTQRIGRIHRDGNTSDKVLVLNMLSDIFFDWYNWKIINEKRELAEITVDGVKQRLKAELEAELAKR